MPDQQFIENLISVLGDHCVITDPQRNEHFRKGFRSGEGDALAVLFPEHLIDLWKVLQLCVAADVIIIMQAANTGLTEGSTPNGADYDREIVIINTLRINQIHLLNNGQQIVGLPGATLHALEKILKPIGRSPHSEIGSSCIGASIVGGIANNSGGALCKRGPAYTELSLYAQVTCEGQLELINHLGIDLGTSAEEILQNLELGNFSKIGNLAKSNEASSQRAASDQEYATRIRDVDANTPSRFNADPRRLFEASGCAGKLAVFAVRLDTFPVAQKTRTFYIGTNDPQVFSRLRRGLLTELPTIPELGEYLHRDMFDLAAKYGKDNFYVIEKFGTQYMPAFFSKKGLVDARLEKYRFIPRFLTDRLLQLVSKLLPQHLPKRMLEYRKQFEHHLIVKMADDGITPAQKFLQQFFSQEENPGNFFECSESESRKAMLHRFVSAGAAMRYHSVHFREVGELLPLDIALRRNDLNWEEQLPESIRSQILHPLYYGHFLCHVFHQDYILKKGTDARRIKAAMLEVLDRREARYPAEHNVGHLYRAGEEQKAFYKALDPTNTFNPGIGKMDKRKRNCSCC